MFCKSCGQEIRKGKNFCGECGYEVNENASNINIKKKKKKKKRNIIIAVIAILFIVGLGVYGSESNKYVEKVKGGSFNDYPNVTIGKAFDSFFHDPEWSYFEADDGRNIVEFKGECTYDGEDADALIQFQVADDGTFHISYFSLNNISQSDLMIAGLVDKVVGEYQDDQGQI